MDNDDSIKIAQKGYMICREIHEQLLILQEAQSKLKIKPNIVHMSLHEISIEIQKWHDTLTDYERIYSNKEINYNQLI